MRLLRSFSFRLALLYAVSFTVSVLILLALYYWISIIHPTDEVQTALLAEASQMESVHRTGGAAALATTLQRRAAQPAPRRAYHALIAADGRTVTNNLPSWPAVANGQWLRIEADVYRDGDEDDHEALVLDRELADGSRLLIGRDIEDLDEIEEAVRGAVLWLLPPLMLLVIAGSALMSRAIGRRLEAMSATALRVMNGDLSGRVAVRGGNDDFDRLGRTLNAMLDRLEASLDAVRRVSDGVAHELRTPLSRLRADLSELATAPPEAAATLIARAEGESDRLSRMFDGVLRISRIEARRHDSEMQTVELSAIVADAADYHAPQAEERGLALKACIEPSLVIRGDRDLLFQAVTNLIDNAVKFAAPSGSIRVSLQAEGSNAVLTVADSGAGLPDALLGKLGERFFRAPSAGTTPGFGLGLALVRAVAELHGSQLTFANGDPGFVVAWRFEQSAT